ncbi:MAG: hypothetical protein PHE86_02590 [Candidatus Marinimicrobia bacterium]|nr:hypothetical protein [Candidatus Neomarinimicrobiota bacterium]MDD5583039.1 hypothetical protein [Candidatus Neomarinimicrobiota bacterium]
MKFFYGKSCLLVFVSVSLFAASPNQINGWIHRGNGDIFPGELTFSENRIVSVRRVPLHTIDTTRHLMPAMFDLNLYPLSQTSHVDSFMISRGIGFYLADEPPYVFLKTINNIMDLDTLGLLIPVPKAEGHIYALYQYIYDSFSEGLQDTCRLLWPFKSKSSTKIWWYDMPGMWISEFETLLDDKQIENVWIVREKTLTSDMIFGDIRMILTYEDLKHYEAGKSSEFDWFETLGNTGIQFPQTWIYSMQDSFFIANKLSREIFLQLMTVLPTEFLDIEHRFGLLVPGYSASIAIFKKDSKTCEHLLIEGKYVY